MIAQEEWEQWVEATKAAIRDPQPGDRFNEMYSFWLYVVAREGDEVTTMEDSPPCTFPEDAHVWRGTLGQFWQRLTMSTDTPWVILSDRGNSVGGWLESKLGSLSPPCCHCHTMSGHHAYICPDRR